jgi:sRNA-binding carbon storage regulator CsrA
MALALTRRPGESVWVGETLVHIVDATPNRVKLAFEGPAKVLRAELSVVSGQLSVATTDHGPRTTDLFLPAEAAP